MEILEQHIISELQKMQENKMSNEIIIPLLVSLGYFKVEFYGGTDEHGKDILCWEYDRFDELKLTVAQVKHFKFTSKASDSKSFQTVYNQLAQCFSEQLPFSDKSFHLPDKAILISTYELDTKALKARISNQIWSDRITIIDGFKLAKLLKKYKPELVKKIIGIDHDIYSSLEPTLNNKVLLKSLGLFESKSIKHIYIDIDFSLGKTTTQLFFNFKLLPSNKILKIDKDNWAGFKLDCMNMKSEFGLDFLSLTLDNCEEKYIQEMSVWSIEEELRNTKLQKSRKFLNDKEISQIKDHTEPNYEISIFGEILAEKIKLKREWIEKKTQEYNLNGAEKNDLKMFISKCKIIIDCASIIFDKKKYFYSSLGQKELLQYRNDIGTTRLKLSIEQIFDTELHFSILGDAGAGKTTCLQMYTINKNNNSNRIYIYLPLSRVIQREVVSFQDKENINDELDIESEIVNYLISSGVEITIKQFQNLLKVKKVTLLLDGLDEAIKKAPWLKNDICDLSRIYQENIQIIITYRTSGNYDLPFLNITLLPFTNEQKFQFIDCWFKNSNVQISEYIKNHLKKNELLSELVNNPLLATILCVLAENQLPLPTTELKLYNDRLDLLTGYYDSIKNITRTYTTPDILKTLAQKLAFYLHSNSQREEDIVELEKIAVKLMLNNVRKENAIFALRELIDPCNILVPMTDDGKFGFGHLRFQEHLAAKEIINNRAIVIDHLLNQAWWRSVLAFFSSMNNDLTWFIKQLGQQNKISELKKETLIEMINVRPVNERVILNDLLDSYLAVEGWNE